MNVVDVNDNQPEFDPASYSQLIYENVPVGTTVINISATDVDSGEWNCFVAVDGDGGASGCLVE